MSQSHYEYDENGLPISQKREQSSDEGEGYELPIAGVNPFESLRMDLMDTFMEGAFSDYNDWRFGKQHSGHATPKGGFRSWTVR